MVALIAEKIATNPEEQKEDEITKDDMDLFIVPNLCKIMAYYNIPSESCISADTKIVEEQNIEIEKSGISGLKILFVVL
jgi:putative effector of murein hydrolase LrgA (UPF0299 family)